jgi:hypothetical protein
LVSFVRFLSKKSNKAQDLRANWILIENSNLPIQLNVQTPKKRIREKREREEEN